MNYLYFGSEQVFMCRNVLQNKVFENGIAICANKKKCSDLTLNKSEIDSVWIPFGKDIIDTIMTLGIVPVRFSDKGLPYIPKAGTYDIHVITDDNGMTTYELHDKQHPMEPVPDSIVLHNYGYDPRIDGSLTSMIKTLEPIMQFVHHLSDAALCAEETRCNPPVICEKKETQQEMKEGLHFDSYIDGDTLKTTLNSHYQRDEAGIRQLNHQRMLFSNAISGAKSEKTTTRAMNNLVPLPNDFRISTLIEPSGRNDYVQICRMASEIICSVIGVPRSMIISDNVVRGDIQGSHDVFKQSCLQWKNIISSILTAVYRHINKKQETDRLTKLVKKRKLKNLDDFASKEMVQIVVPVTPYISSDELKDMYLHQIISWSTYKEYVLRNASLPLDLMKPNEPDPWSKEEKKELLGISSRPEALKQAPVKDTSSKMESGDKSLNRKKAENK
jgi:hypothetical protein